MALRQRVERLEKTLFAEKEHFGTVCIVDSPRPGVYRALGSNHGYGSKALFTGTEEEVLTWLAERHPAPLAIWLGGPLNPEVFGPVEG